MQGKNNLTENARICMERMNAGDQLLRLLGIKLVECRPGYGKAVMPLDERQLNAAGLPHGGALFSLADIALAMAANCDGGLAVTLSANISFFKSSQAGPFTAEAREVSSSSKVSNYEVLITDATGEAVCNFTGIAYKKHLPA